MSANTPLASQLLPALVLFAAAAGVGAWGGLRLRRAWAARRLRARMDRARRLEALAEPVLARAGYRVVATQVTARYPLVVDGARLAPEVRADCLVTRGGRTYVAEAKSGPRATVPTERATRRQLLEYALVYDVDGVLLVNPEAGTVTTVEFPGLRAPPRWSPLFIGFLCGAACGVALALAALPP